MSIPVTDPFGVADDTAMPSLAPALAAAQVQRLFGRGLPGLAGQHGFVYVQAIRVTRYKPGRRCVIEYDVEVKQPDAAPAAVTLIGKVRRQRFGNSDYRLLKALWDAGFDRASRDGISVPEPIGTISKFRMWLQRKVPGRVATDLMAAPQRLALARRIADAAHKLHSAGVPAERHHTMADELRLLHECLPLVGQVEPKWLERIERLLAACDRIGTATPELTPRGIHRDFYADQVVVDDTRLYLIDFDTYSEGHPGLDIGNFLGHITEQSLRTLDNPRALADVEDALEERFVELSGPGVRPAVRAYAMLTLVRHIYLSTLFPERRPFTGSLLELCEERLHVARAHH